MGFSMAAPARPAGQRAGNNRFDAPVPNARPRATRVNRPQCGEKNPPKFRLCGCGSAALAPVAAALPVRGMRGMRMTVTMIFFDLNDFTALGERLDSQAMRDAKDRYFKGMAAEFTRHGGKTRKLIGDAIMAVFGLPRAHEDDALRTVRAAAGMRTALVQDVRRARRRPTGPPGSPFGTAAARPPAVRPALAHQRSQELAPGTAEARQPA